MNESKVSTRYTKALMETANSKGIVVEVKDDIQLVAQVIKEVPEFAPLMDNPVIKPSVKENVIKEIFEGKIHQISLNFLLLVLGNKREAYLRDICRVFIDTYRKNEGIQKVVLTTAKKLGSEELEKIKILFKSQEIKDVEMEEKVDSGLIGGFVLKMGDKQYDASVASQLQKVKRELIKTNIR